MKRDEIIAALKAGATITVLPSGICWIWDGTSNPPKRFQPKQLHRLLVKGLLMACNKPNQATMLKWSGKEASC